jgi:glyoxalase family protein
MKLEGIHHVTAITADARRNLDFYVRALGLRFVKKTVNFDAPDVYHLYYGDETGAPGTIMTFFEFPGAARGRAGDGMIHRVSWRVGSDDALAFWAERLADEGVATRRDERALRFDDPEGLELELVVYEGAEPPLAADAEDIPAEHRLLGFHGARAYASDPEPSAPLLADALGFERSGDRDWIAAGDERSSAWGYDPPPPERGLMGAGTVHHIAWATQDDEQLAWQERVAATGAHPTPVIDRDYFKSVYFREPSAVLFEVATMSPGFAVDEAPEALGEGLKLPKQHEHLRERLEQSLTPLPNPRPRGVRR